MNAIAVDDEPLMLYALVKAVKASSDITSVVEFGSCEETLKWVEKNLVDAWNGRSGPCAEDYGASA